MSDVVLRLRDCANSLYYAEAVRKLASEAADEIEMERQHAKAGHGMRALLVPALQGEVDRLTDALTVYGLGANPHKTKHEIREEILRGRSEAARTAMADGRQHA